MNREWSWMPVARVWLVTLALVVLVSCGRPVPTEVLVLNDFESSADLERIAWRCGTTFSLSKDFFSHGKSGLLMTLYPSPYPGLHLFFTHGERRWLGYGYLAMEVFNPGSEKLSLTYRIDDSEDPDYGNLVNGSISLKPGLNHWRLDLSQMQTSGTKRGLNLGRIDKLLFFLVSPPQPVMLAVDNIRLEPVILPR